MNLDELRAVQSKERQKDSLQHLRPSFYQEVADYIAELKAERERVAEAADDPFSSPEVGRLTDEIETAKDVVEAIYERRMGKLVKQASLAAAGMPANDEGLTAEESDLFEDLVDRIDANKTRVLDVLDGTAGGGANADTGGPDADAAADSSVDRAPDSERADPAGESQAGAERAADDRRDEIEDDVPPIPPDEPPMEGSDSPGGDSGVSVADVMGGGDGSDVDGSDRVPPSSAGGPGAVEPPGSGHEGDIGGTARDVETPTGGLERDGQSGGAGTGQRAERESESRPDPDSGSGADASTSAGTGTGTESTTDSDSNADVDRVTVRITQDIGSILGIDDREYTLTSDDVVTLPEQNATPLVERDAAEPLN